ncbi:hypothetical protein RD792_010025 [Penstemon davidsonii]|uniref:Uncharacterized protein n=1 Tax=Penstemon davidsonii TaxID=160366 RepID=A0ABR0D0R8_9LAMI|nr:hypothetical protein RD792_010025 [Penstemon davidsonii]
MSTNLSINSSIFIPWQQISSITPSIHPRHNLCSRKTPKKFTIKATSPNPTPPNPSISPFKTAAASIIFAAAAFGKFPHLHAKAEISSPPQTLTEDLYVENTNLDQEKIKNSPLTQFLETSSEAIDALKKLLQEKLEVGEDEESLSILKKLSSAQPDNLEWKFLIARVSNELGKVEEARDAFEEILAKNPLSFEALFENALLMDKSGERESVMGRLEVALSVAENEKKVKEARDVKLIMAQMQFLQKNVEEALRSYEELVNEDPSDFRPYFCKGMIFSLLDKNEEAREQFAKYRELSPKKFEVEGYLRTPLSRMKLFGTDEEN